MRTRMAILQPTDLEKVQRRQIQNILAKQAAGKTLSAREERALVEASTDAPAGVDNFARTWDELALRVQTSRKTLQNVQKRFPGQFPPPRPDGRHEVAAWLKFFIEHNINRAAEDLADNQPITVTDWKAREIELKCTKLEIENAKTAGELIDAAEVESGTSHLVSGFRQALNNFVPRLADKIVGVKDYHEAEELIQSEVNVVLRTLQSCAFLESSVPPVNEVSEVTMPVIETVSKPCSSGKVKAVVTSTPRPLKKTTSPGSGKRKASRSRASRASSEVKRK